MLKNLNVIKSEYEPKDTTALWLKKVSDKVMLYWYDGLTWSPLTADVKGNAVIGDVPQNINVNGTSEEFFKSLYEEYEKGNIEINGFFQGQVNMTDLPGNLGNGEIIVQVIKGLNGEPIFNAELTTTSYGDNHSPYKWDYSSRGGTFEEWIPRAAGECMFEKIYVDDSSKSKDSNMAFLEKYGTDKSIPVILDNKDGKVVVGNYYNGTITTIVDDTLHVIDISFDTGEISTTTSVDITKIEEYTHLEIGDSTVVKTFNLEKLKTGTQLVSIDYGYGVATWNSTDGGVANINTANGHVVTYDITADGKVSKAKEGENAVIPNGGKEGQYLSKGKDGLVWCDDSTDLTDYQKIADADKKYVSKEGYIPFSKEEKDKLSSLSNYTLPIATDKTLGGIKVGANVTINEDGTISVDLSKYDKITDREDAVKSVNDKVTTIEGYFTNGKANTALILEGFDKTNYYTKSETDSKVTYAINGLSWKEAVDDITKLKAIAAPKEGWTVSLKDTNAIYRFDDGNSATSDSSDGNIIVADDKTAGAWVLLGTAVYSVATDKVDGLMSKSDKAALDKTVTDISDLNTTISNKANKSDIPDVTGFAKAKDIEDTYAKKTDIPNISDLQKTADADAKYVSKDGYVAFSQEEKDKLNGLKNYTLPVATDEVLGGIKVGSGINKTDDGVISIDVSGKLDKTEAESTFAKKDDIPNVSDFITETNADNKYVAKEGYVEFSQEEKDKLGSLENYTLPIATDKSLGGVKIGSGINKDANGVISVETVNIDGKLDKTEAENTYAKKTDIPTVPDVSDFITETDANDKYVAKEGYTAYTEAEKTKLAGLENYTLPQATDSTIGGVKIGSGINLANDGTISVSSSTLPDSVFLDMVSYGIEWDTEVADSACTRIGNMSMHKTLPIQSGFKGCVAKGKDIQYYLDPNDWSKKADGSASVLDGTDGDVRVDTGYKWYYKGFESGTKRQFRMSQTQVDSTWVEVPRMLVSAWGVTLDRTDSAKPKACVVMNTSTNFRGGNNSDAYDGYLTTLPCRANLGKPVTNVSRLNMRTYIANAANNQEILCYDFYKALVWCYYVEYANFNCQLPFNAELTSEGYHQGGLGNGLTTFTQSKAWNKFNFYSPITPCGYLNDIGNFSGTKELSIPTIVIDDTLTINAIKLTPCKYRGFENLFGDYWKNLEGIVLQKPDADSANVIYVTSDNTKFDDEISNKEIRGVKSKENGYIKTFVFCNKAEIIPATVGGNSFTYKSDYHYTNNEIDKKAALFGGDALSSASAGFGCLASDGSVGYAYADRGFFSVVRL